MRPKLRWAAIQSLAPHGVPTTIAAFLFAGVIAWQALASGLLRRAFLGMRRGLPGTAPQVTQAFAVRLALWAALLIATEATVPHVTAGTHKETLIAQLAGLLVIRSGVVPARSSAEPAQEREPAASRTRKQ